MLSLLGWAEGPSGRDPSKHQTCDLELSSSLSGIRLHSLMTKLKTHLFSSAY